MWKVLFALGWLFLEGAGLPLLSEAAFGPLGVAIEHGDISSGLAFVLAWASMSLGNVLIFTIFYRSGPSLLDRICRRWPSLQAKREQAAPQVQKQVYGAITVARLIGFGLFQIVLWIAGASRVNWRRFLPCVLALNMLWTALWLWGSHRAFRILVKVFRHLVWWQGTLVGLGLFFVFVVLHYGYNWWHSRRQSQK